VSHADLPTRISTMTVGEIRRYLLRRTRVGRKTVNALLGDSRCAVRAVGRVFQARLRAELRERRRLRRLGEIEEALYADGTERVVGVDEAGRAPFAGPVVAAAVILPRGVRIKHLDDSKRLDAPTRARLFDEIRETALDWAVGMASPRAIDVINIYQASVAAMRLAVAGLETVAAGAEFALLIDGRRIRDFPYPHRAIVDGDARCRAIAAASIVAKVTRDRLMESLHEAIPRYNFRSNKGYGTAEHVRRIREHGICPYHRRSFAPVWDLGESGSPEFRLWQEEIMRCEDERRLAEVAAEVEALEDALLPQELRTLARLLQLASQKVGV
jgi:ribonuclease HII